MVSGMRSRWLPAVLLSILVGGGLRVTAAAPWLEETFDTYAVGPLDGQGDWTGSTRRITVVSTASLAGHAVLCDADESPMLPVVWEVHRPVAVPDAGQHVFSFAVRVETPTPSFAPQATLVLGNSDTYAIQLEISPLTADLRINNDFLDCFGLVVWDLGNVPGGHPDLTTGTYHLIELDLDFGRPGDTMDDVVRAVRMDGKSYDFGCGAICLQKPMDSLVLINGTAVEGSTPDAVFFDSLDGRPAALEARRWPLY